MATTTISFTFQNTDLVGISAALCAYGNLPNTQANAKQVIVNWVQNIYQQSLIQGIQQTAIAQAAATAGAVVIT